MSLNDELIPRNTTHPGILLKEELEERGIKQNELANELGILPSQLNEILKGKRQISPELCVLIGASLGTSSEYWNNLQANYNLDSVKIEKHIQQKKELIEKWKILKTSIPIKYLRKQEATIGDIKQDIETILKIFEIATVDDLIKKLNSEFNQEIYFRKSNKFLIDEKNVFTWLSFVKYLSKNESVKAFDFTSNIKLLEELKYLFNNINNNLIKNLIDTLKNFGIKLIVRDKPDQTPIDGAAFWQGKNPVIGLTLRYKRLDNLIYTLYHELGHVFLHLKNLEFQGKSFIDNMDENRGEIKDLEEEANCFARNSIVSDQDWNDFIESNDIFDDYTINSFALKVGSHPASIRGRLCFEDKIHYSAKTEIQNQIP